MSQTTDPTKKRVEQLTEYISDDRISRGVPDVGSKSSLEIDDYEEAFIDGALERIVELVVEHFDEREHDVHPMDVTDPDNVVRIYLTDPPWQAPIVVLECKTLPEYAQITSTEALWIRPNPALSAEQTWARFQFREANNVE